MAPAYVIDAHTLRERPIDAAAAAAYVVELERAGDRYDAERVSWLRMLGRLQEAETLGWAVLGRNGGPTTIQDMPDTLRGSALLPAGRLASVLHWSGRTYEAWRLFQLALSSVAVDSKRSRLERAFLLQHYGKLVLDLGKTVEALELFREAAAERAIANAPADQLSSTDLAIAECQRRLLLKMSR